jgi:hypothetical protein
MVHGLSSEAWQMKKFSELWWNTEVHDYIHKGLPVVPILRQLNAAYALIIIIVIVKTSLFEPYPFSEDCQICPLQGIRLSGFHLFGF